MLNKRELLFFDISKFGELAPIVLISSLIFSRSRDSIFTLFILLFSPIIFYIYLPTSSIEQHKLPPDVTSYYYIYILLLKSTLTKEKFPTTC